MEQDLGQDLGKLVGLMAQLRAWDKADGQLVQLGTDTAGSKLLDAAEKLLTERFQTKAIAPTNQTASPGLLVEFERAIGTGYSILWKKTKHYKDQWRLLGLDFTNEEVVLLVRALEVVKSKRHILTTILDGTDFYSGIMGALELDFPEE